jgi:hypothetical protein
MKNNLLTKCSRTVATMGIVILCFSSCSNHSGSSTKGSDPKETNPPVVTPGTEETSVPVYAIWKKTAALQYDGLYDASTGYIRLCETGEEFHIDDPSTLTTQNGDKCYRQGNLKMIIIKRDSSSPLFLTVLHVDPDNKKVVGVTDRGDTIATSVETMEPKAFEKLKAEYRATSFNQDQVQKIKEYYSPDKQVQNETRKEQAIKMQPKVHVSH